MLADRDLDAVMIATGDHQHARILAEVVRAGKDCYCEKPMANTLEDAKLARDAVKASKQVVQMGSQWLSDPYQQKVREHRFASGKLGKIVSISQSWNFNGPRWHVPNDDNIAAIREQDTDWNRWLLGRPSRPFDPRVYFEFRIFKDFSGGITDQWYSHGSGLAHFYLDTFIPDDTVAQRRHLRLARRAREPGHVSVRLHVRARSRCSTPTARRSGTATATTRSSAARAARCTHRAARAARSGGSCRRRRAAGARNVVFDLQDGQGQAAARAPCDGRTEPPPIHQDDDLQYHTDNWLAVHAQPHRRRTATSRPASRTRSQSSWPRAAIAKARRCTGIGRTRPSSSSRPAWLRLDLTLDPSALDVR